MKSEKNIFLAFILNLAFSIFEFMGGIFTGSVAILSDAVHDIGDASSIGISYLLEKKSKRQPDEKYTYGYGRYSAMGGVITTLILLFGSLAVIFNAASRILSPTDINYNGMLILASIGVAVNLCAELLTGNGDSLNQKAVNLHMLEDVLGWILVLCGAILMRFTDISIIDPVLSILVSAFILINAVKNLKQIEDVFLEKIPQNINLDAVKAHVLSIDGIEEVHHMHIWSMDGYNHYATMHVVTEREPLTVKKEIRQALGAYHIGHVTLELESRGEKCDAAHCHVEVHGKDGHHHHHHH